MKESESEPGRERWADSMEIHWELMGKSHWLFPPLIFFSCSFSVIKNCHREREAVYSAHRQYFPKGGWDLVALM